MAKKINTRKKGVVNIDELKAYRVAYGKELGPRDYMTYVGVPALLFGGFSFLLLYNLWVSIPMMIFGGIYGWRSFLPKIVRKQYEYNAARQRNKFLNNMTQVLTDDSQTPLMALRKVTERASGEFEEDLRRFQAMLIGADNDRIREAVIWFSDKYDDDIIFVQYLEQIETIMLEGKTNIDTLQDIKTYHNDIQKKQELYERAKMGHVRDMRYLLIVTVVLLVALAISFGFDTYLEAYARHPIGYISSGLYMSIIMIFFRQFSKYLFDDSVMEISN